MRTQSPVHGISLMSRTMYALMYAGEDGAIVGVLICTYVVFKIANIDVKKDR